MTRKTTLITDFDNTLYDWFLVWHQSFSAMLCEIKRISGIGDDVLLPQIRKIHQQNRTSEYAFLVENLPCLQEAFPNQDLRVVFDDAIHAYRSARIANLKLYDGVRETLTSLRASNVLIALFTDSLAFYTIDRIKRLGLDDLVDFVFSPPDHEVPETVTSHEQRGKYQLAHAQHRHIPDMIVKPNPEVLLDIVGDIGRSKSDCVYVGDSLMKDVAMAQDAKIMDVWAKYGVAQHREGYPLLRKVSHWTEADVQREKETSNRTVTPTHTISQFSEISQFFRS